MSYYHSFRLRTDPSISWLAHFAVLVLFPTSHLPCCLQLAGCRYVLAFNKELCSNQPGSVFIINQVPGESLSPATNFWFCSWENWIHIMSNRMRNLHMHYLKSLIRSMHVSDTSSKAEEERIARSPEWSLSILCFRLLSWSINKILSCILFLNLVTLFFQNESIFLDKYVETYPK